jgi:hypothetical protein
VANEAFLAAGNAKLTAPGKKYTSNRLGQFSTDLA